MLYSETSGKTWLQNYFNLNIENWFKSDCNFVFYLPIANSLLQTPLPFVAAGATVWLEFLSDGYDLTGDEWIHYYGFKKYALIKEEMFLMYSNQAKYDRLKLNVWAQVSPLQDPKAVADICESNISIKTTPVNQKDTLRQEEKLTPGSFLQSQNGQYVALMQTDGNFVVYRGATVSNGVVNANGASAIWHTSTYDKGDGTMYAVLQGLDANCIRLLS